MRKLTTEEFIIKAKAVHGDRYDYSKSVYLNKRSKLIITCYAHGEFSQFAGDHLQGKGCMACGGRRQLNNDEFISAARTAHGDRYSYRKVDYRNAHSPVIITCSKHGDFMQEPNQHTVKGFGCRDCGNEGSASIRMKSNEEFIQECSIRHGDKYSYDMVNYTGGKNKVEIICKNHGSFMQTAQSHAEGQGCPKCAKRGFDRASDGYVYYLISEDGQFIKVGISGVLKRRMHELSSRTPFNFKLIKNELMKGSDAIAREKYFHEKYQSANMTGFDGATEWLKYSKPLMDEIMK